MSLRGLLSMTLAAAFMPLAAQHAGHQHHHPVTTSAVPLQPLAQQARRLETALQYLGQPLRPADHQRINAAVANADAQAAVAEIEDVLDQYVLSVVSINPESRVKVEHGPAKPELMEGGTRLFLVKVINEAHVTAPLTVDSPNSGRTSVRSTGSPDPPMELTETHVRDRWADISLFHKAPMAPRLSGLALEYQILEVYSRDRGQRSAEISFHVGQGTQDIGFRNDIMVVFESLPARDIKLQVHDENGKPTMASFLVKDRLNRIYPNPSKRLAPDFPFQPQVYREDGESIRLPEGYYTVAYTGGPEYMTRTKEFGVDGKSPAAQSFKLERWIDPSKLGWYSGDHHVHAAGCSHYQNPTQGVEPRDMIRQIRGEGLNIGSVLTWGPCYYYQKQHFSGKDHALSRPDRIMRYDLEVSGFPSSHTGHLIFLNLKEQDYPRTQRIEDWPTWGVPILQWGKSQDAVSGFAHSGWGLQVKSSELPNFEMPGFDGIGANEYVVAVTHPDTVDFISAVDTPYVWELNVWYHTLNVGFRTRISGETDFPCIYDDKVGLGRTYAKIDGGLSFDGWVKGLRDGRSYVSDGKSHLMEFRVNGLEVGSKGSELKLAAPGKVRVQAKVAAMLDPVPNEELRTRPYDQKPYWDVERARIAGTREVPVEVVVNGIAVGRRNILADGQIRDVEFEVAVDKSSWIALRILPSSHTNPVFALVDGKPVRTSSKSAEWLLAAVNQCWSQKAPRIREPEREAARKAYDHARETYRRLIAESK